MGSYLKKGYELKLISTPLELDQEKRWNEYTSSSHNYGPKWVDKRAYIEMEETDFRLKFASGTIDGYKYRDISEEDLLSFYKENLETFTRQDGNPFSYQEVRNVILKRFREKEYEEL